MDPKGDDGQALHSTYIVPGGVFSTFTLLIPSGYTKTIVIIAPLMKFGGVVALNLLGRTGNDVRIVVITQRSSDIESLRSQLPSFVRNRLLAQACEFQSPLSIKMTVLFLRMVLDRMHIVVHLVPQLEPASSALNTCDRMKALLCANDCSIQLFRRDLLYYFGDNVPYKQIEFPLMEEPVNVVRRVVAECI